MKKLDLNYAAGFIDADGCILIGRFKEPRMKHKIRHVPTVCAAGISKPPLRFLQNLFGGKLIPQRRVNPTRIKSNFPVWQWAVSGHAAVVTARHLMPFLRIKSVQAYLLSCFEYEAHWSKGGRPEDVAMPDSEFQRREQLHAEIRSFNNHAYASTL